MGKQIKTDVVYVLGSGSQWNNNEIRFSVRSLYQNLKGFGRIFIIGENPGCFTPDVIHIQHPDEIGPHNADGNIIRKVLRACQEEQLSDNFLFINDDHFILKPTFAPLFPALHKGDMNSFTEKYYRLNFWRKRLLRTRDVLNSKNLPALHFDLHTPILFNKHRFPDVMEQFDYHNSTGYTMKSLYGNVEYPNAIPNNGHKVKIFTHKTVAQIEEYTRQAMFLSINDGGLNDSLRYWLWKKFPNPSPVEATPINDKVIEIAQWCNSDRDYHQGVDIFKRHINHVHLVQLMEKGKTDRLEKKLNYILNSRNKEIVS